MAPTNQDRQRVKNKRVEDEASHIATKKGERIVIPLLFSLAVVATAKFLYVESRKKAKRAEAVAKKVKEEAKAAKGAREAQKEAREAQKRGFEEMEEWSEDSDSDSDGYTDDSDSDNDEGSTSGSGSGSSSSSMT